MSLKCQRCQRNLFQKKKYYLLLLKRKWLHQLKVYFICIVLMNHELLFQSFVFTICWEVLCPHSVVFFFFKCLWLSLFCLLVSSNSLKICESHFKKMCVLSLSYTWKQFRKKEYFLFLLRKKEIPPPKCMIIFQEYFFNVILLSNLQN